MRRSLARSAPPQVSKLVARTNQPSNGPSAYADGGVVKDVGVRPPNDGQAAADDARPRPPEDATAAAVHVGVGRDRRVRSCGMSCVGMYVCMYVCRSIPRASCTLRLRSVRTPVCRHFAVAVAVAASRASFGRHSLRFGWLNFPSNPPSVAPRGERMPAPPASFLAASRCIKRERPFFYCVCYATSFVSSFLVLKALDDSEGSRGIVQPEAFCAGTTPAYRKGTPPPSPCARLSPLHPLMRATCTRLGAQASKRATAPTSATATTGPECRRMLRRLV